MKNFTHLHVHTQYSILDGASSISGIIDKAKEYGMNSLAITDHGNMFGVKAFHKTALKKGMKPIIGCEAYVAKNSRFNKNQKEDRSGFHLILLAKNKTGYQNLIKLISYSWTEGFYYKPRIDKELLFQHHEGLIISTACLGGEIPQSIMLGNLSEAEKKILEYKDVFNDDFYLELQLHPSGDSKIDEDVYQNQLKVNASLLELSKKTGVKVIATNDVHFINKEDAGAHDHLICLNTGKDLDDLNRMRYTRQEYLKSPEEMAALFPDCPEALANTQEIAEKVENYDLNHPPIMPEFKLPEGFENEAEFLRHISYEGARNQYGDLTDEVKKRLDFELETIINMGFPGYFLIVWDVIKAAREMGVSVGPGRGSAAGSVIAYCLNITSIDPIKYDLLFERFLNPDRISMPDIDIDFDEDGRDKVLQWVVAKYGKKRVAHIVTFGTMAAKMAIRDVGRVQKLPLFEADRLAKMIPERPGTTLSKAYKEVPELEAEKKSPNDKISNTLNFAEVLEGSVRQTGVHACGIIIGRDDLENYIPLSTAKETELFVTQYDGKHVEDVGMLKMDFLGLKTLSIIKDTLENIKESEDIDIDIDNISLDDQKTFDLYSRGETTGLFQFESTGMKKYLRGLKPNRFEDLIAMNALYRPGPMDYIPSFIKRKHGKEEIHYDVPIMEEYLSDTYGITVYQEQVMLLSQELAGFTKGMADSLRKAMGKKIKAMMDDLKQKFFDGCKKNGHEEKAVKKIWNDWEAFAQYAFNKSHSTCYAYVSYQTAYLKANYPAEFMAAVLSRNISDIKKVGIFMDECKRMGIKVLGPDVNESSYKFKVNANGDIRFGLGAIKGMGENAVAKIVEERKANGPYKNIYDFIERINLQVVNKKSIESLAMSGGFDNLESIYRSQYFGADSAGNSFIENLIRYGNKFQGEKNTSQQTLFGEDSGFEITKPSPLQIEEWGKLEKLNREKELVGMYLSAHPLDEYKLEIANFCNTTLSQLADLQSVNGKEISIAGIVTLVRHATTKTGRPFGSITIEDYTDSYQITLFSKDYENFRKYFYTGYSLFIKGKVQPRPFNAEELEVKVKNMNMLSDIKEEIIQSICLNIELDNLSDGLINELKQTTDKNKGKVLVKFNIFDPQENNLKVSLFSRSQRIELTREFLDFLEERPEITYMVN